jgi:hypothetical protein
MSIFHSPKIIFDLRGAENGLFKGLFATIESVVLLHRIFLKNNSKIIPNQSSCPIWD